MIEEIDPKDVPVNGPGNPTGNPFPPGSPGNPSPPTPADIAADIAARVVARLGKFPTDWNALDETQKRAIRAAIEAEIGHG